MSLFARMLYNIDMKRTKKNDEPLNKTEKAVAVIVQTHPMRRSDWQEKHERLRNALFQHWINHQKVPSRAELSKITGLSVKTIERHWKNFDFKEMQAELKEEAALMVKPVLFGLYNGAIKGNHECAKLLIKLGADLDLSEKKNMFDDIVSSVEVSEAESAEQTITFEQKVLKITRRLERDKALGVVDAEVIDGKKEA